MAASRLRRCATVLFELREYCSFDFNSLISGGDGLALEQETLALAPHLMGSVAIDPAELIVLGGISSTRWCTRDELVGSCDTAVLDSLLAKGLLVAEDDALAVAVEDRVRNSHWWAPAAAMHYASRWQGIAAPEGARTSGPRPLSELYQSLGPPPPHTFERVSPEMRKALPVVPDTDFDALLDRRTTCRNFDTTRPLPLPAFAQLLRRVFGARGTAVVPPDVTVMKRTSPSGGGLHPTEAYLLVQHVEGVERGLYRYHPVAHALEPLRSLTQEDAAELALRMVAGQEYFSDAHALVAMASRFPRSLWKYRNHTKAYRAAVLDVGHLSQTLYLCATEQGLAAYVTAAINEVDIEDAFSLDPLEQSPLTVSGFGWRSSDQQTVEFDPLQRCWSIDDESSDTVRLKSQDAIK